MRACCSRSIRLHVIRPSTLRAKNVPATLRISTSLASVSQENKLSSSFFEELRILRKYVGLKQSSRYVTAHTGSGNSRKVIVLTYQ
jgi:hypothetical protein